MIKLPFDKIYCIHLAEDEERYKNIFSEFQRLGISEQVEIWWTCKRAVIDSVSSSLDGLQTEYYKMMDKSYPERKIFSGVFNCALEHYTIIKQAYLRGFESILIMEDDASFCEDINFIKSVFENIPFNYDLIKFYSTQMLIRRWDGGVFFSRMNEKESNYSTLCYALSKRGMKRYIEIMDNCFLPSDLPFNLFGEGYNSYISNYEVVKPNSKLMSNIVDVAYTNNEYNITTLTKPLLSIIMPCYNSAEFVAEAIRSVKLNKYENWECVIVNDGSTDNSEEVILKSIKDDNRFRLINIEHQGVGVARNVALKESKGDYILPLDSDDLLMDYYPSEGMDFMVNHPNYSLYFGGVKYSGIENGVVSSKWKGYADLLNIGCIFVNGLYRKEHALAVGGYDEKLEACEDYEFWIRYLYHNDNVMVTDKPMIEYRTRSDSRHFSLSPFKHREILEDIWDSHQEKLKEYGVFHRKLAVK